MPSSPISPRDLGLKEKQLQSIEAINAAYNIMVRRLNDVYKYNRRDHDRLTEDVAGAGGSSAMVCTAYLQTSMADGVLPDATDNLVLLDNTLVNTGSAFDAGNNRITITDAGNYLVTAQLHLVMGNDVTCYLRVKDSDGNIKVEQLYRPKTVAGSGDPVTIAKAIAMSANDWLALYAWHASDTNQVNGNAEANMTYPTYLSVIKI